MADWLDARIRHAPPVLRQRIAELAAGSPRGGSPADALAILAREVVTRVAQSSGDRSVALDLLAADALITLALLAQAETEPSRLTEFAQQLLTAGPARA
jgi:hypothetical protein